MVSVAERRVTEARYCSSLIFGHREVRKTTSFFERLPDNDLVLQIRRYLTQTMDRVVTGIKDVEFVESASDRHTKRGGLETCIDYIFPEESIEQSQVGEITKIIKTQDPIKKEEGALALYFDDYGNFCHIGRVVENGLIESKWYLGNVYHHPPELVPDTFGTNVIYFPNPYKTPKKTPTLLKKAELSLVKKLRQVAAAALLVASLNLPDVNIFSSITPGPAPAYASTEVAKQKEIAPINLEVLVPMYHEVTAEQLENDFVNLIEQGYQPISLETFVKAQRGEIVIPQGLKVFMPTLDDSLASQYEAVIKATERVQERTGWFVPVTIFAITKFDDLGKPINEIPGDTPAYNDGVHAYLTRDQLINLIRRGHQVQPHSVNHPNLTILTADARNAEIKDSDDLIEGLWVVAGRKRLYRAFAYPYGARDKEILNALQSMGFDIAFITKATLEQPASPPFEVERSSAT